MMEQQVFVLGELASYILRMLGKTNSARIMFSDGTEIDPDTGKTLTSKEKANWRKWVKDNDWRVNH